MTFAADGRHIAIIVNRFPSASETFILNELRALERRGFQIHVASCTHRKACDA